MEKSNTFFVEKFDPLTKFLSRLILESAYATYVGCTGQKGRVCGRVMGQRISKWVCIVPPVILSRAFVTPNANYMSTVHAPYHGRPGVTDGTIRVARANGPLPHQRRLPDLETF